MPPTTRWPSGCSSCERAGDIPRGCGVLLANILAEVLISLNAQFAALLPPGGQLLLAGLLAAAGIRSGERVPEVV